MTVPTPITMVWEPTLSQRSLPGGLPWSSEEKTSMSGSTASVLTTREMGSTFLTPDVWIAWPLDRLTGRRLITSGDQTLHPVVRYQHVAGRITGASIEREPAADPVALLTLLDFVKARLQTAWEPLLDLLSIPRRTFFAYRQTNSLPADRISDLGARIRLLSSAIDEDIDAVRLAISARPEDLKDYLDHARYGDARALFRSLRLELQTALGDEQPYESVSSTGDHFDAMTRVFNDPGFDYVAQALVTFSVHARTWPVERFRAVMELESALVAARTEDSIAERWSFLPLMRFPEMDAFRVRTQSFIISGSFTSQAWDSFLEKEAERAWEAFRPIVLPPDPIPSREDLDDAIPADLLGLGVESRPYSSRVSR